MTLYNTRWALLTSGGLILKASAIFPYSSLTLEKPSILPVGLPCASCVWNTSLGLRLAGGGGRPAPFTEDLLAKLPAPACPLPTSSFSTNCSFVDLFFFLHGPNGIFLVVLVCFSTSEVYKKSVVITFEPVESSNGRVYFLLSSEISCLPSFHFSLSSPAPHRLALFFDRGSCKTKKGVVNIQQVGRWWVWDKLWHNLLETSVRS